MLKIVAGDNKTVRAPAPCCPLGCDVHSMAINRRSSAVHSFSVDADSAPIRAFRIFLHKYRLPASAPKDSAYSFSSIWTTS